MPENSHFFVLEDTVIYQKRIAACLIELGFKGEITLATNMAEANKLLSVHKPDCFICDWNLPDGIGTDFVKIIRSNPSVKNTPIIMITTMDQASHMLKAIQLGADGFVVKPYYPADVLETLAFAFNKRSSKQEKIF